MKKFLSCLVVFVLLISTMSGTFVIPASAATSGTTGDCTWTLGGTELTISGNGAMGDYTYDSPAPWGCDITSVVIENGVATIGDSAFYWCESLTSVTIGNGVTTIGDSAFNCCTGLISLTIPDSVTSIGDSAFYWCESLTSVTIGNGVTTIGDYAFAYCDSLTSITIPDSVTSIGEGAFYRCESLTAVYITSLSKWIKINFYGSKSNPLYYARDLYLNGEKVTDLVIPDGVTSIGNYAFYNCDSLTSVTIPDSVTSIGNSAFEDCYYLTSATIPDSVTSIGEGAFYRCESLTAVYITSLSKWVKINFYGGDSNPLYYAQALYLNGEKVTDLVIPDGVTSIGNSAFFGCDSLTSVTIPDSVTTVGDFAFNWCTSLTSVTIGNSVTTVGENAFKYCYDLRDVWYSGSADDRKNIAIESSGNGYLINATWHYNTGATGTKWTNPFKDVKKSDFYYTPVLWAVANKVTSGTSDTTFEPNAACTRGQIVTFLWRAAGSPAPKRIHNPFKDVGSNQYYYKAVLWAVENGITAGTSATTFEPNAACTRGQIVTFLCRAAGSPAPKGSRNPFKDVGSNQYYYKAVLWAVENGITAGTSATTFEPNAACTRGQIVTFLYRSKN